ncbi:MAG: tyrosine-type recombinase/integrase [Acidobacteria bacterium]|nr:tyrosine-type recombinase/integrase [Acidobacteriota bacterium]
MAAVASIPLTDRCKVARPRWTHETRRPRNYLLEDEVDAMIKAARRYRHGARDGAMVLLGYRHGLRVSELVALQWAHVDWKASRLHVRRRKGSSDSVHPLQERELRILGALQRLAKTAFIFESERGGPMAKRNAQHMIEKAGRDAKLSFPVCAHMLRHGRGYQLANEGRTTRDIQDYLGHRNLNNVERYTKLAADRFKDF